MMVKLLETTGHGKNFELCLLNAIHVVRNLGTQYPVTPLKIASNIDNSVDHDDELITFGAPTDLEFVSDVTQQNENDGNTSEPDNLIPDYSDAFRAMQLKFRVTGKY